jgi:glucose-6-phosphate 1-dehydrogenase
MSATVSLPTSAAPLDDSSPPPPAPPSACATLHVVVFGATGDLARRKLLPAVGRLAGRYGSVTAVRLLGVGRSPIGRHGFLGLVDADVSAVSYVDYVGGDYDDAATYDSIASRLGEAPTSGGDVVIFYVATPPGLFPAIAEQLGRLCARLRSSARRCRVLVEKPVGHDLASADQLLALLERRYLEGEVGLVDHYLAKPAVRQLDRLRATDPELAGSWDRTSVSEIHVTVAETLGVEGRGGFYDGSGALRDVVQNHGLQLCAAVLSERPGPTSGSWSTRRLRALAHLSVDITDAGSPAAVRGQYGTVPGSLVRAYVEEPGVPAGSRTETFAALRLRSSDPRWRGVPVYLRTGKRMAAAAGEVHVVLRGGEATGPARRADQDVVRLDLRAEPFVAVLPGDGGAARPLGVPAAGSPSGPERRSDAGLPSEYEQLLHAAVTGVDEVFASPAEVRRSWEIVEPVVRAWAGDDGGPAVYPSGSWGPAEADALILDRPWRWRLRRHS